MACYTPAVFTGLVQTTGVIRALSEREQGRRLEISAALAEGDRILGASVCVSGVCLTVVESSAEAFAVDVGFETLAVTTIAELAVGDRVNLEPSLRLGDALGGHLVSGHVDGVGQLRS
ncbi:MAG: riboflavin synthase, partial [Myxococcales bacterium]|nr:riboflavin synthase [Myxococcales bacterium]